MLTIFSLLKLRKMLFHFQKQSQKMKVGDLTKIRILPFLCEAATVSKKIYIK